MNRKFCAAGIPSEAFGVKLKLPPLPKLNEIEPVESEMFIPFEIEVDFEFKIALSTFPESSCKTRLF